MVNDLRQRRGRCEPCEHALVQVPPGFAPAGPDLWAGPAHQVTPAKPLRNGCPPPVTTAPAGQLRRTARGDRPGGPATRFSYSRWSCSGTAPRTPDYSHGAPAFS